MSFLLLPGKNLIVELLLALKFASLGVIPLSNSKELLKIPVINSFKLLPKDIKEGIIENFEVGSNIMEVHIGEKGYWVTPISVFYDDGNGLEYERGKSLFYPRGLRKVEGDIEKGIRTPVVQRRGDNKRQEWGDWEYKSGGTPSLHSRSYGGLPGFKSKESGSRCEGFIRFRKNKGGEDW